MKKAILAGGIRVANFSSPHPFRFVDGTVLEACSPERANAMALEHHERVEANPGGWDDIKLEFRMSDAVKEALDEAQADPEVDLVIVPLPVLELTRGKPEWTKFRGCRTADRVTKTIFADRFCV